MTELMTQAKNSFKVCRVIFTSAVKMVI